MFFSDIHSPPKCASSALFLRLAKQEYVPPDLRKRKTEIPERNLHGNEEERVPKTIVKRTPKMTTTQ